MIYCGDALKVLKNLPDKSVNCCVTSPPYWGLRDYGVDGQIGLEHSMLEHIEKLVEVFREVRRVLRDDGVLWINYGDSYSGSGKGRNSDGTHSGGGKQGTHKGSIRGVLKSPKREREADFEKEKLFYEVIGLLTKLCGSVMTSIVVNFIDFEKMSKRKDLMGMPWLLAFALKADGWYLRSDVVWNKPNAMPESVADRPARSHEYLFLFSKKPTYFFDHEAIKEEAVSGENAKEFRGGCYVEGELDNGTMGKRKVVGNTKSHSFARKSKRPGGQHREEREDIAYSGAKRNARSVWTIATQACREAHFATFPDELAARCIKAGCPDGGIVLDPFLGSGTTYAVANGLGRQAIGIELNPEYVEIARGRIGMFVEVAQ